MIILSDLPLEEKASESTIVGMSPSTTEEGATASPDTTAGTTGNLAHLALLIGKLLKPKYDIIIFTSWYPC